MALTTFQCSACSLALFQPNLGVVRAPPTKVQINASRRLQYFHLRAAVSTDQAMEATTPRRSANYPPTKWDDDFVQSLNGHYKDNTWLVRVEKLKQDVIRMLEEVDQPLDQLELIDCIQRLGVGYHFERKISEMLNTISMNRSNLGLLMDDLHSTALFFRLLRQHGFEVSPQEVFARYVDDSGSFKASLCNDPKGMLSLYEASFLAVPGETLLDEARGFTCRNLKNLKGNIDSNLERLVEHALEVPLHWKMLRSEARWFIDTYERMDVMNPVLLQLAKLDFNMVQAAYQAELIKMSSWWKNLGLAEKLSFSRSRLVACHEWTIGMIFHPKFGHCREDLTKVIQLLTTVDDVYDVYGSLDELELFTEAFERWDTNAMEELPQYMKLCFLAVYNNVNEIGYHILKRLENGHNYILYLKKSWADLCKAYLVEAKWYYSGYKPTFEEYINNAWISISGTVILTHFHACVNEMVNKEDLDCIANYPDVMRWSAMILRLADDLATSTQELARGDVPESIQCYMHETGCSEATAREYVRTLISETWKKLNQESVTCRLPLPFIGACLDLARTSQYFYQFGDGHGAPDGVMEDRTRKLLVEPIPLTNPY